MTSAAILAVAGNVALTMVLILLFVTETGRGAESTKARYWETRRLPVLVVMLAPIVATNIGAHSALVLTLSILCASGAIYMIAGRNRLDRGANDKSN